MADKKVYILTSGSYSEYTIDGVTLSHDKAEKIVRLGLSERWEAFDVDTFDESSFFQENRSLWLVTGRLYNRTNRPSEFIVRASPYHKVDGGEERVHILPEYPQVYGAVKQTPTYMATIKASSREVAEKVFYDQLAEFKAEEAGIKV